MLANMTQPRCPRSVSHTIIRLEPLPPEVSRIRHAQPPYETTKVRQTEPPPLWCVECRMQISEPPETQE